MSLCENGKQNITKAIWWPPTHSIVYGKVGARLNYSEALTLCVGCCTINWFPILLLSNNFCRSFYLSCIIVIVYEHIEIGSTIS
jgi:hypothetical protein